MNFYSFYVDQICGCQKPQIIYVQSFLKPCFTSVGLAVLGFLIIFFLFHHISHMLRPPPPTMLKQALLRVGGLLLINPKLKAQSMVRLGSYSHHVLHVAITCTFIYNTNIVSKCPWEESVCWAYRDSNTRSVTSKTRARRDCHHMKMDMKVI